MPSSASTTVKGRRFETTTIRRASAAAVFMAFSRKPCVLYFHVVKRVANRIERLTGGDIYRSVLLRNDFDHFGLSILFGKLDDNLCSFFGIVYALGAFIKNESLFSPIGLDDQFI